MRVVQELAFKQQDTDDDQDRDASLYLDLSV